MHGGDADESRRTTERAVKAWMAGGNRARSGIEVGRRRVLAGNREGQRLREWSVSAYAKSSMLGAGEALRCGLREIRDSRMDHRQIAAVLTVRQS